MSMRKVFLIERKLSQVAAEYNGMIEDEDMKRIQALMVDIDKNFVVPPEDLVDSFENFMAALATALHVVKQRKR